MRAATLTVVAAASIVSYADSIAVAPVADASGFETQFNLTLDVSAARYLCAGWAETDQGANYADWTNLNFKVLGEVDSSTTSWTFDAPKGWGDDICALRFFLVEKETAPYDQRLEYIESTGQEWVNTGYIGKSEDHYYLHFAWLSGGTCPMAAMYSSNHYAPLHLESGKFGVALNSGYPTASNGDMFPNNRRNVVSGEEVYTHTQIKTGGGNQFVHVSTKGFDDFDDTSRASYLSRVTAVPRNKTAPLFIFARNTGCTSTDVTQGDTTDNACAMRLWSCYATHDGTPVLDLVPCVKDGEAMLYDRVNTRFLRNVSGAGAFIAGPAMDEQLFGADVASSTAVAPSQGTLDAVANPPAVRTVSVGQMDASGRIEAVLSRASAPGYLYVAYGSAAGGDTPESWENCDLVGFFDTDSQKVVATVPGWGSSAKAMRFFLKDAQTLPFDAQVEWIRSSGSEYLDTGRAVQLGDVYTVSFRSAKTDKDYILVGAYKTATDVDCIQIQIVGPATTRNVLRYAYGYIGNSGSVYNGNDAGDPIELGVDTTLQMSFLDGNQTMLSGRMGETLTTYKTSSETLGSPKCDVPNYIFARNVKGTGVDQFATARIYSVKVENGGETAQDFIPVVKDGAAGMYDRQNGTLHWNKGTGAFVAGPEIANSNFKPGESLVAMSAVQQCEFRTIAVSDVATGANGETLGFRLALGPAVQNETCRLVFAYGVADGGDDPASWDGCIVAGTVAPGDASFDFTIPSGLVSGAFKYRFFLVADGAGSPGVTEVPYIESTGSEYINTGYIGTFDDVYDVSWRNLATTIADHFLLGAYGKTKSDYKYTVVQHYKGKYSYYLNRTGYNSSVAATKDADHRVRVSFEYNRQEYELSTDGGATYSSFGTLYQTSVANTTAPLYIFARNCNNAGVDNTTIARLYSCTIRHNGETVRDFVPCVKNGEAGVYDRVLGRFHGNISGAGELVAATDNAVASPAVYSCTASGDGTGADSASKAGAISSIAAQGAQVTVTAPVASLGAGTTYPYLEWWIDGGATTNFVALSAIPSGGSAGTQTATFDTGNTWGQTIYCRFAVSNTYATATAGTAAYHDKSFVRSVAIADDATYTWQAADGEWNGGWADPAHWSSSRPGNCIGYPTATSTAKFAAGTTAVVSMPDGLVETGYLTINEKNIDITFLNAGNATTLKPVEDLRISTDTNGASWNSRLVFDGVSLQKKEPASAVYVCNDSSIILRGGAKINSTVVTMVNDGASGTYTGRLEIGAGSVWPTSGEATQIQLNGDGVVSVEGTFNVQRFLMGQGGACYYGGGTLELCGANPSVNVSGEFRCRNIATYVNPSYIAFDIPADGWASAPLKGGASAAALAGTSEDSADVRAKIVVKVPAAAPIFEARKGKRTPFKVPLIDWPTGITADRCELVAEKSSRVRFAWTYGGTDSEVDDGNPPTGLVAYVTGAPGLMIVVQ